MFGSKKKPKGPFTLPIAIGREKIDDVTVTIVSALPASFVISEILRTADEEYHVIGLEKFDKEVERWTKLKNDDDINESCEHVAVLGDWERISKNPTRDWSANWYECYTEDEMLSREDELKLLIAIQEKKEKAAQEGVTLAATDAAANTFALGAAEKDLKDAVEGKKTAEMDAAANTFAKNLADKEMADAMKARKEEEARVAAESFREADADKKRKEAAAKKKEEQQRAAAETMKRELAEKKMKEASAKKKEAEERLKAAKAAEAFRMSLVNANFREAIKSGDKEAIEREGAKKLQSVWRIKQAQKEVQARKDAFLDAAARKVQSCYRIRLAKKRVQEMKVAYENACARKIQSAYQIRKARRKVGKLREKVQNAAARKLQGAWRIKVARKKVAAMKAKVLDAAARKVQCCYRIRLAKKKMAEKKATVGKERAKKKAAEERLAAEKARLEEYKRQKAEAKLKAEADAAAEEALRLEESKKNTLKLKGKKKDKEEQDRADELAAKRELQREKQEKEDAKKAAAEARRKAAEEAFNEAETERQKQAQANAAETFRLMKANSSLKDAIKSGDPKLIEEAAARKLQSTWRSKAAQKIFAEKKAEADRQAAIEEQEAKNASTVSQIKKRGSKAGMSGLFGAEKKRESTDEEKAEADKLRFEMSRKAWKVRNLAYEKLIDYVSTGTPGTPERPNTEKMMLITAALEEDNPIARANVLEATIAFVKACEPLAVHTLPWMLDITLKGFNKNAKQKGRVQLVQTALLLMMEVDRPGDFCIAMLQQALKENNVDPTQGDDVGKRDEKKTQLLLETVRKAIERFGVLSVKDEIKEMMPMIMKLATHRSKIVKDEAVNIMYEITVRIGESSMLTMLLSKFGLKQRIELQTRLKLAYADGKTPASYRRVASTVNFPVDENGDELEPTEENLTGIEVIKKVDMLGELERGGFAHKVDSTEWAQRIDGLTFIVSVASKSGPPVEGMFQAEEEEDAYDHLVEKVIDLVTDKYPDVTIAACKALEVLTRGLGPDVMDPHAAFAVKSLLKMTKQKKASESLHRCLDALWETVSLVTPDGDDVIPSLKPVLKDIHTTLIMATTTDKRLPVSQMSVCVFVQTCVKNTEVEWDSAGCAVPLVKTMVEATGQRYPKEIKAAALETMALVVARQRADEAKKVEELEGLEKIGVLSKVESAEFKLLKLGSSTSKNLGKALKELEKSDASKFKELEEKASAYQETTFNPATQMADSGAMLTQSKKKPAA